MEHLWKAWAESSEIKLVVPFEFPYTERMKNETSNIVIEGYNNQLRHWDAKKKILEQMIKDLNKQLTEAHDEWNHVWRERQQYINVKEEKELVA